MATERTSKDMLQEVTPLLIQFRMLLPVPGADTVKYASPTFWRHPADAHQLTQHLLATVSEEDGAPTAGDAEDTRRLRPAGMLLCHVR